MVSGHLQSGVAYFYSLIATWHSKFSGGVICLNLTNFSLEKKLKDIIYKNSLNKSLRNH